MQTIKDELCQKKDNLDSIKKIEIPILKLNVSKMQVTLSLMIA